MLRYAVVLVLFFALASELQAAADDVTYSVDTNVSAGGYTLVIAAGSKVASSTVGSGSLRFGLENGSSVIVRDAGKGTLDNSLGLATQCHSDFSYFAVTSATSQSVTVTPLGGEARCYSGTAGGGATAAPATVATTTTATTTVATTTAPVTPTSTAPELRQAVTAQIGNVAPESGSYKVNLFSGSSGPEVTALQNFLKSQGEEIYPEGLVTGYFGPLTRLAVGRFQLKHGIVVGEQETGYGLVGPKTRAKINELVSPLIKETPETIQVNLSPGSSGPDVTALQNFLKSQGSEIYPEGLVTGYFGGLTRAAVGRFQIKYGIVSGAEDDGYGYVGPKTRKKINELVNP